MTQTKLFCERGLKEYETTQTVAMNTEMEINKLSIQPRKSQYLYATNAST